MMKPATFIYVLLVTLLLPVRAWAAAGDDFGRANRAEQAKMLEAWGTTPEPSRLPFLKALAAERVVLDSQKQVFDASAGSLTPLGDAAAPVGETQKLRLTNRLRNLAAAALASHYLVSDNVTERLRAAVTLQRDASPEMATLLETRRQQETDGAVRDALITALALLNLTSPQPAVRLAAAKQLENSGSPQVQARLQPLTDPHTESDADVRAQAEKACRPSASA